jgi:hypothetical protein
MDNRLTDGCKVVSPMHRPRSPPQRHYFSASGTHFCWRLSDPQGVMPLERLGKLKTINSPHRVSNPRPSGLLHSALTTTLPRAPHHRSESSNITEVLPTMLLVIKGLFSPFTSPDPRKITGESVGAISTVHITMSSWHLDVARICNDHLPYADRHPAQGGLWAVSEQW